ncbi:tryptophan--tRNA ligase [Candidatus Woesearchaeota archaeon]|jgi:tryptophanyl-tRNA synthetase|nr:tryptophan--tRNA ligase [Candidatus Woesearchaeota archaeon]MBT4368794.1 tryptophan--tRNA ligase [Candidatus Woesearchaeota archaeon]MBT4712083.1 tryptophan--tRNA ligase [Candidatus Woesearchaeota archaeon]MBT6639169.1 tryptophan--tRNA ligase [Candidatus Woesearchaeota archaeon]MBT7134369.1 tryptophan--tRNA ligase [Candidatus Woesearchaeota archaeon]
MTKVTPWDVEGKIDYDKLIREFGVQKITTSLIDKINKIAGKNNFMLDRKIFFAHRDLEFALKEHEKDNLFLYTGCGPSGSIHLGHAMVWKFTKWLQDVLDVDLWFQFTDDEKFLFKDKSFEEIQELMKDNMLDVIALGFNPKKTHFLIDTKHASIMYPEAIKVAKKLTASSIKSCFGLGDSDNVGMFFYTAMQAVPAFLPSILKKKKMACLIPHAIDQDPHFRLTRDILPKLGFFKPASIQCSFLPPLTGVEGKMSSSGDAFIALTDTPEQVKKKINKYAFSGGQDTLEEHRKRGGNPDIDISFQYLRFLFEPDDKKLSKIKSDYRTGKLLSGELKKILIDKINDFLKHHQAEREKAKKKVDQFVLKI